MAEGGYNTPQSKDDKRKQNSIGTFSSTPSATELQPCPVLLKKTVVTDQSDGRQIQKTFTVLQYVILCLVEVYVNIMLYRMAIKKSIMY